MIREPFLLAFSTASSEAALPRALEKMVEYGVPKSVAGFVIPAGYSFNLDGSTLYISLASLTIAQAAGVKMPLETELLMMLTFMLTSKGVAGVPRASLVIIAAGCAAFNLPGEAGVAMILAVDELMDMARTSINVMGNCVASVVVARWEGVLTDPISVRDEDAPAAELAGGPAVAERGRIAMRKRLAACGLAALLVLPAAARAAGMKIYISVDMEGIAGVVTNDQLGPPGFEYERFRGFMTNETLAAIEGARAAGATEFVVSDSHGNGESLLIEKFPKDVTIVRAWPRPLAMMQGIDESFAGVLFVGYHASTTNPQGVRAHTMSSATLADVRLNGALRSRGGA